MKLKNLKVKNILSFGKKAQDIVFHGFNTIVGPNNSGKTNVFRIISLFYDKLQDPNFATSHYYRFGKFEDGFEVSLGIDLTDEEKSMLTDFFTFLALQDSVSTKEGEDQNRLNEIIDFIIQEYSETIFKELFDNISLEIIGQGTELHTNSIVVKTVKKGKQIFIHNRGVSDRPIYPRGNCFSPLLTQFLIDEYKLINSDITRYLTKKIDTPPKFNVKHPSIFDYILKKRSQPLVIYIHQLNINYLESRYANSPKIMEKIVKLQNFLFKYGFKEYQVDFFDIISLIFKYSLIRIYDSRYYPTQVTKLTKAFEPPIDNVHILTGTNLPNILFGLRNSSKTIHYSRYKTILHKFKEITGTEFDVTISAKIVEGREQTKLIPINLEKANISLPDTNISEIVGIQRETTEQIEYKLNIQIVKDNYFIPLEFAAAGVFEILLLLTAMFGFQSKILLLDEPALNLHPVLQKEILNLLTVLSVQNTYQVVIITHSPYFTNTDDLKQLWHFSIINDETIIHSFGEIGKQLISLDRKKIIRWLRNSDIKSLLFSKGVVFVEGLSDKVVVEKVDQYLSSLNKGANIQENGWTVIDIQGKDSLQIFLTLIKKIDIPYVCVMDYDALMRCDRTIKAGLKLRTSTILYCLYQLKEIPIEVIEKAKTNIKEVIKEVKTNTKEQKKQYWYSNNVFDYLFDIAKSKKIFVLKTDLEGALRTHVSKNESKPIKAHDRILEMIRNNTLGNRFDAMIKFIRKHMTS